MNEIKTFYEAGKNTLWITFHDEKLWYGFANTKVNNKTINNENNVKIRKIIGSWQYIDLKFLRKSDNEKILSIKNHFQGTIRNIGTHRYQHILDLINNAQVKMNTLEKDYLTEDTSLDLDKFIEAKKKSKRIKRIIEIKNRSQIIIKNLKKLYDNHCQISGTKFLFKKINKEFYSEGHHLIPLGKDGSDSYSNTIIVSPLIHRMLHYADISKIDIKQIKRNSLPIYINNKKYYIRWKPQHLKTVKDSLIIN